MGWFWGNSGQKDPTKQLDPELREYLEKESPARYTPTDAVGSSQPTTGAESQARKSVPAESLFPDGRYAHLWKNYKPLAETEDLSQQQSEMVIQKVKQRKDAVHQAALENCALEHEALTKCFSKGDWWSVAKSRATICAEENRKFSRCYTTQAKFLQALGYAAAFEWDEEREERIQMHADKLYHQMLDYEKRVEEAKKAGVEPPPLTSLFNPDAKPISATDKTVIPGGEQLPEGYKPSKPLEEMTPHERELEIRSFKADMEQQKLYADMAAPYIKAHEEARAKTRQRITSWFGETIGKWFS